MGRAKKAKFPTLGTAGRAVLVWLKDLDAAAMDDNYPLVHELATLADGLGAIREQLRGSGLTILEQTRLRGQEVRLSEAFRKSWVSLGLAIDTPTKAALARPPGGAR